MTTLEASLRGGLVLDEWPFVLPFSEEVLVVLDMSAICCASGSEDIDDVWREEYEDDESWKTSWGRK